MYGSSSRSGKANGMPANVAVAGEFPVWDGYAAGNLLRCAKLLDPVFREVIAEGALADPHQLRGVLLDAVGLLQRAPHGLALGPIEILAQRHRRQPWRPGRGRAERPDPATPRHRARGEAARL